jgi:hypothetical protein
MLCQSRTVVPLWSLLITTFTTHSTGARSSARSGKQEERTLVFPQGEYTESPTLPHGGFLPAIGCVFVSVSGFVRPCLLCVSV